MSAPEYVPTAPDEVVRSYTSPPRRPEPWLPVRPGDIVGEGHPVGERFGNPGPDQGYVYKLIPPFESKVHLMDGEDWDDVKVGGAGIALKRASLFGRAPVVHDLTVAFGLWGFLEADPPADLVDLRRRLFATIAIPSHYAARRALADTVPESTLRRKPADILSQVRTGWRNLIDVEAVVPGSH